MSRRWLRQVAKYALGGLDNRHLAKARADVFVCATVSVY